MTVVTRTASPEQSSRSGPLDPRELRRVMSHYPTGVVVVGALVEGRPEGMAAGSFLSVSLDPPLVAFCADHASTTWPRLRPAGAFAVSVLGAAQQDVCRTFAQRGVDRFAGQSWTPDRNGHPVLAASPAWFSCRLEAVHVVGDHDLVVGRVEDLGVQDAQDPLVFLRGGYPRFSA
jgi:flavin reductase (DIM6/NTAB) family NADH-FMN oxidoreductase RutF